METIKSVEDLPIWFKEAKYAKNLDAIGWYREIRKREWASSAIVAALKDPDMPEGRPLTLFRAFHKPLKETWSHYDLLPRSGLPIQDMSKAEAMFLAAYNDDDRECKALRKSYKNLIRQFKAEIAGSDAFISDEYEEAMGEFFDDWAHFDFTNLDDLAYRIVKDTGNPFLGYANFFRGYPIIVDTNFDDETILEQMRQWLAMVREEDEPKAKKPFTQNNFDDWTYFKIREVYDLDTWSRLAGIKILDKVIAAAVWANAPDEVSPLDMLRTTTRKKAEMVFTEGVCRRLYAQISFERSKNFLEE